MGATAEERLMRMAAKDVANAIPDSRGINLHRADPDAAARGRPIARALHR
jgi:hypothetical protein